MQSNFSASLAAVLAEEGGFVHHPDDPGGATNRGITQAVYDEARASWGAAPRSVREIKGVEVDVIYRDRYWSAIRGDDLPAGVDLAVFDAAVNSGPGQAAKWLQRAINAEHDARGRARLTVDGAIGPRTVAAAAGCDLSGLIQAVCDQRVAMLKSLRTWPVFGRGWSVRVARVRAAALTMIKGV